MIYLKTQKKLSRLKTFCTFSLLFCLGTNLNQIGAANLDFDGATNEPLKPNSNTSLNADSISQGLSLTNLSLKIEAPINEDVAVLPETVAALNAPSVGPRFNLLVPSRWDDFKSQFEKLNGADQNKDNQALIKAAQQLKYSLFNDLSECLANGEQESLMIKAMALSEFIENYKIVSADNQPLQRFYRFNYEVLPTLGGTELEAHRSHRAAITFLALGSQEFYFNPKLNINNLLERIQSLYNFARHSDAADKLFLGKHFSRANFNNLFHLPLVQKLFDELAPVVSRFTITNAAGNTLIDQLRPKLTGGCAFSLEIIGEELLKACNLSSSVNLIHSGSAGDGCCGYHSLNVACDGPLAVATKDNVRFKMSCAINDHINQYTDFYLAKVCTDPLTLFKIICEPALQKDYNLHLEKINVLNAAMPAGERDLLNAQQIQTVAFQLIKSLPSEIWLDRLSNVVRNTIYEEQSELGLLCGLNLQDSGELDVSAWYVQLWAKINHLNIFCFANRPNVHLQIAGTCDYEQIIKPQTTAGTQLAYAILTSQTAKNIFILNPGGGHYDGLVEASDTSTMTTQRIVHGAWTSSAQKYEPYP